MVVGPPMPDKFWDRCQTDTLALQVGVRVGLTSSAHRNSNASKWAGQALRTGQSTFKEEEMRLLPAFRWEVSLLITTTTDTLHNNPLTEAANYSTKYWHTLWRVQKILKCLRTVTSVTHIKRVVLAQNVTMKPKLVIGPSLARPKPELQTTLRALGFCFTAWELKNTEAPALTLKWLTNVTCNIIN